MGKRGCAVANFLFFFFLFAFGQEEKLPQTVAYYGAVTDVPDVNMVSMTQDLFYNQLLALDTYTVVDRRDIIYSDTVSLSPDTQNVILFYAEIFQGDTGWDCTLHAKVPVENGEVMNTKHYDSYYRVLTDAKTLLTAVLQSLDNLKQGSAAEAEPVPNSAPNGPGTIIPAIEALAGNWRGEPFVDRVVILRGGRGFVIYKNGASMNISVKISGDTVYITQESKQNASYFPDIARDAALIIAQTAPPVEWFFHLDAPGKLRGAKKTVKPLTSADGKLSPQVIEIPVIWERE
ncbi:MAG: hypothetical protein LBS97_00390 [Treponema sp.]|jgi:hypothetical protein|nr:hypothetical protein [Treponema sp.]